MMCFARALLSLTLFGALACGSAAHATGRPTDVGRRLLLGPACWDYRNALGEEFLLKLRTLRLGPASFVVSGALQGEEGRFPVFGNLELLDGELKGNLALNASFPSVEASEFISAVHFVVELAPDTLDGVFEWISPTLSGPGSSDPAGRTFAAYSVGGTLRLRSVGRRCAVEAGEVGAR